MSGELIFSEIWMAITVPIKMEMMTTIQRESTPNLYISFINCLKNMLHRLGTEMHFPINMTYSPILCNALFIILLITYLFQSANITEICQQQFTVYDLFYVRYRVLSSMLACIG